MKVILRNDGEAELIEVQQMPADGETPLEFIQRLFHVGNAWRWELAAPLLLLIIREAAHDAVRERLMLPSAYLRNLTDRLLTHSITLERSRAPECAAKARWLASQLTLATYVLEERDSLFAAEIAEEKARRMAKAGFGQVLWLLVVAVCLTGLAGLAWIAIHGLLSPLLP